MTAVQNVADAIGAQVASHLHPPASYDLADHPLPSGREEIWRFTPLKRLGGLLEAASPVSAEARPPWTVTEREGVTLRQVSDAEARALGEMPPVDRAAGVVADAFAGQEAGAWVVEIPAEAVLVQPVIVDFVGKGLGEVTQSRLIVQVGRHAKATVVFAHSGSARYNALNTVVVGDGAQVDLVTLQLWADDAVHLGRDAVRVGRDAQVRHIAVTFGGDLVRLNTAVQYEGPGGDAELLGIYFADAGQHLEHRLFVDHNQPKTKSNVDYRGALQGEGAHSVWVGDVLIRKIAEGIETYESNKNLILTDGCRADSVPNLEIETGQIAGAGHASTTGRFDDQQLFYLQARGIPEHEARRLVVRGFFDQIIHQIGVPEIEERLTALVEEELTRVGS